ncbi:MAG: AraC family transcriptional regulator [Spirochaetaceae bacterium]|nr:MAG: AraC family transcriptional regulator [Spirochaetaceae bacterium]
MSVVYTLKRQEYTDLGDDMASSADRLILERWTYKSTDATLRFIVPDGCQDLIHWSIPGEKPRWTLSHLQDGLMTAHIPQGAELVGYRFAPGTELPEAALNELAHEPGEDPDFTITKVLDAVSCDSRVAEALLSVAELSLSIENTAGSLGVSRRTLERLLLRYTGRPPVFWSQLARVRAAARALVSGIDPVELAYQVGYSDQAHMSRAVKRWFGVSPSEVLRRAEHEQGLLVHHSPQRQSQSLVRQGPPRPGSFQAAP